MTWPLLKHHPRRVTPRTIKLSGPIVRQSSLQFFVARAQQARADADAATLEHVRDRCLRSEAAWSALAEKAERTERMREADAKRKAEQPLHC